MIDKIKEMINSPEGLKKIIETDDQELRGCIFQYASSLRDSVYGKKVFFRGLIEFTNYCKNDCFYCGIRRSNTKAERYRLTDEQILDCCRTGYNLGFRTFVLQGGEDDYYTDDHLCALVSRIKTDFSDCCITLSIGERSRDSYARLKAAGAERYLLRHETADEHHYRKLHPPSQCLARRKQCLYDLKDLGYQVGAGLMVGSPFQTTESLVEDLFFLRDLQPHMVGIGPYIPHKDTPFADFESGTIDKTLIMLALTRILLPNVLLPATTAVGTLDPKGREKAFKAGANVVMPNLSPIDVREAYSLYNNKICTGDEAASCVKCIGNRIRCSGLEPDMGRGDYRG